ncbi:MAG: hypothetical protein ACJAY5_000564 [Actinomycetes bacterium]|jgi:hypothetical protein
MATLFLHIGTHKTGSTYLQNYLRTNVAGLREEGWSYPDFIRSANHLSLPFIFEGTITPLYHVVGMGDAEAIEARKQLWVEGLSANVTPTSRWIITSEFFSQRLNRPDQVQPLIDFLRQYFDEIVIVGYARRQEYVLPSIYSQDAKAGRQPQWSWEFCRKRLATNDHNAMFDVWSNAVGVDEVRILPFLEANKSDTRALLDQFSEVTGIVFPPHGEEPSRRKSNRSLSVEGIAFVSAINPHLPLVKEDGTTNRPFRGRVMERVTKLTPGPSFNPADDVIEMVHDHYQVSNQAFVDKLPPSPLWDEWLAQPIHNDKPQALVPTLTAERTVELMIALSQPKGIVAWGRPDKRPVVSGERTKDKIARRLRLRKRGK